MHTLEWWQPYLMVAAYYFIAYGLPAAVVIAAAWFVWRRLQSARAGGGGES